MQIIKIDLKDSQIYVMYVRFLYILTIFQLLNDTVYKPVIKR